VLGVARNDHSDQCPQRAVPRGMLYLQVQRSATLKMHRNIRTYGTMGQMARDRLVIRGLLCSAWRAVTIPIYARGAQVADNRALISGCVGNYCQLIIVVTHASMN